MALVLVTFRIMPESVEVDLNVIEKEVSDLIVRFGGEIARSEKKPIAFGLLALDLSFSLDEKNSNLDPLEDQIRNVSGVESVQVIDVRRAVG